MFGWEGGRKRGRVWAGREGRHGPALDVGEGRLQLLAAGQGARTARVTQTQRQIASLTDHILIFVNIVVIDVTFLVLHILVVPADGPGHAGSLAGERHHLLGLVLHGCQRLLDRLLPHLAVVPAQDGRQSSVIEQ